MLKSSSSLIYQIVFYFCLDFEKYRNLLNSCCFCIMFVIFLFWTIFYEKSPRNWKLLYFVSYNNSVAGLTTTMSSEGLEHPFPIHQLFQILLMEFWILLDFYIAISTVIDRSSYMSSDLVLVMKSFDQNNQKCF